MSYCRADGTILTQMHQVADLGPLRLPGSTLLDAFEMTAPHPLALVQCPVCGLLQLAQDAGVPLTASPLAGSDRQFYDLAVLQPADTLHSYATMVLAGRTCKSWVDVSPDVWTGILARVPIKVRRTAIFFTDFFASEVFAGIASKVVIAGGLGGQVEPGSVDVVTSTDALSVSNDPDGFVSGLARSLEPARGQWVLREPSALSMLQDSAIDLVTHSRLSYWSAAALDRLVTRHGLEINDLNEGAFGTFYALVSPKGARRVSASVREMLTDEKAAELESADTWRTWNDLAYDRIGTARKIINQACATGKTVWGYGDMATASTLYQLAGLDRRVLPCVVDPLGAVPAGIRAMASTGIPVVPHIAVKADAQRPDYVLAAPWYLRDAVVEREQAYLQAGGKMIFAFPECEVVSFD